MTNDNRILDIMLAHHTLIETLFVVFKDSLSGGDIETMQKAFENFKWQTEKHWFIEEKAIFKFCGSPE